MSEFSFNCPKCNATLKADAGESGALATCPECENDFVVPSSQSTEDQTFPESSTFDDEPIGRPDRIPVSSADTKDPCKVVGMLCFTVGTRGAMAAEFHRHKTTLKHQLEQKRRKGQVSTSTSVGQYISQVGVNSDGDLDLGGQYAGASFRSDDLEIAFQIAVHELQLRASYLGANAIIGFRYDLDFDSNANVLNFMATAYGTAVKISAHR